MTLILFDIAAVVFFLFRYAVKKLERAANESMNTTRDLSGELNESLSGMADIQVFNAQPARSKRFSVAVRTATRATAKVFIWMQITNTNSEIYIALTPALVLVVAIAFGPRLGLGLACLVAFWRRLPSTFTPLRRSL